MVRRDPVEPLKGLYLEAANKDVSNLERLILDVTEDPAHWAAARRDMRRVTHDVMGQGAAFGYPLMTRVGFARPWSEARTTRRPEPGILWPPGWRHGSRHWSANSPPCRRGDFALSSVARRSAAGYSHCQGGIENNRGDRRP